MLARRSRRRPSRPRGLGRYVTANVIFVRPTTIVLPGGASDRLPWILHCANTISLARCYIIWFDHVAEGPSSRLADCVTALGGAANIQASLPPHARIGTSVWFNWHPAADAVAAPGRGSANLHLPNLPVQGGVPQGGVSVPPSGITAPANLEARLTLLNPSYGVTSPIRPPHP